MNTVIEGRKCWKRLSHKRVCNSHLRFSVRLFRMQTITSTIFKAPLPISFLPLNLWEAPAITVVGVAAEMHVMCISHNWTPWRKRWWWFTFFLTATGDCFHLHLVHSSLGLVKFNCATGRRGEKKNLACLFRWEEKKEERKLSSPLLVLVAVPQKYLTERRK